MTRFDDAVRRIIINGVFYKHRGPNSDFSILYHADETAGTAKFRAAEPGRCVIWAGCESGFIRRMMLFDPALYWMCVEAIIRGENILRFHSMRALYFFLIHIKHAPKANGRPLKKDEMGWLLPFVKHIRLLRPTGEYYRQALHELSFCPNVEILYMNYCWKCRWICVPGKVKRKWNRLALRTDQHCPVRYLPPQLPGPLTIPTTDAGRPAWFALSYRPTESSRYTKPCCHPIPAQPNVHGVNSLGRYRVRNLPTHISALRYDPF